MTDSDACAQCGARSRARKTAAHPTGVCEECYYRLDAGDAAPGWLHAASQAICTAVSAIDFSTCSAEAQATDLLVRHVNSQRGDVRAGQPFEIRNTILDVPSRVDVMLLSQQVRLAVEVKLLRGDGNDASEIHRGLGQCVVYGGGFDERVRVGGYSNPTYGSYAVHGCLLVAIDAAAPRLRAEAHEVFRIQAAGDRWFWIACVRGRRQR